MVYMNIISCIRSIKRRTLYILLGVGIAAVSVGIALFSTYSVWSKKVWLSKYYFICFTKSSQIEIIVDFSWSVVSACKLAFFNCLVQIFVNFLASVGLEVSWSKEVKPHRRPHTARILASIDKPVVSSQRDAPALILSLNFWTVSSKITTLETISG